MFDDWKFHLRFDLAIPPGRLPLMWCLIAFLLTFLVTRTIVRYIRHNAGSDTPPKWWQPRNIGHGTTHIHHVVIGVILVMISGVTMVTLAVDGGVPEFTAAAIFFGIGAALVLDEFALILHLQDVYWSEDGRTSVDAVFAAVAVAGLLILGFNPLSFFDIDIWRADHTLLARASRDRDRAGHAAARGRSCCSRARCGPVWSGCSSHRCSSSARSGCRVRMRHGRGGAMPAARRGCTGRWNASAGSRRPVVQAKLWLQHVIAGEPQFPDDAEVDQQLDREIHAAPAPRAEIVGAG